MKPATPTPPADLATRYISGLNGKKQAAKRAPPPVPVLDEPVRKLLLCYKTMQGYELDDASWDRIYFRRFAVVAEELVLVFGGDYKIAVACLSDLGDAFTQKGFTWTLDTIVKHAAEWRYKNAQPSQS